MRNVCNALLARKIIPVINENDPVIGEGIKGVKVGDNDTLSALVAGLIDADILVILSDIDGLYDKNPSEFKDAKFINLVENIDENVIKPQAQRAVNLAPAVCAQRSQPHRWRLKTAQISSSQTALIRKISCTRQEEGT